MQVAHAEDSTAIDSIRGEEREFKTLLTGDDNAPNNFRLYFVRQNGAVDVPRHKHNFDQIRMCLEGESQNYGTNKWFSPGELVYFPEGTPYGPEKSNSRRLSITLQFGGASGNGFVSSARLHKAKEEMKVFGCFDKGIFTRTGELTAAQKRNQDSFEAIWEHVNKRKLVYPKPRYGEPILMKPAHFEWEPSRSRPGFAEKRLGVFSEGELQISIVKLEPHANVSMKGRGGVQIGFVLDGDGAVNGHPLRKYSAVAVDEDYALSSSGGMECLLVGLPIFKASPSKASPSKRIGA